MRRQREQLTRRQRRRRGRGECVDCGSPLAHNGLDPVADRCGYPPTIGVVRGHGKAPSKPPRPAAVPPPGAYC